MSLPIWTVTVRTGETTWSVIDIPAASHLDAVEDALRLLGAGARLVSVR
jgi:hypothetical protein